AQALETGRETGAGALAVAGLPVQPAELPLQACPGGAIVAALDLLPHRLVVRERLGTPSDEPEQIGKALARGARLGLAQLARGEGGERALVVADRLLVGVDRPRPVAGGQEITRPARLVGAKAPVAAERLEIAEPFGVRAGQSLQRASGRLVQLGAARQQEVLVDHLVGERVVEAISGAVSTSPRRP